MATCKIASIFFAPVIAERATFGHGPYSIAAVPLGAAPAMLTVTDKLQIEEGPYRYGQRGKREKRQYLITGEAIAHDLVGEWTLNGVGMNPQCHPGIWVVRDRFPITDENGVAQMDGENRALWRPATPEEQAAMWAEDLVNARGADRTYALDLFAKANAMAEDARQIPFIAPNAKLAARQYGLDADWLREGASLDVKSCPMCTKMIAKRAIVCPQCHEVVDLYAYAAREVVKQAAVKSARQNQQVA